MDLFDRQWATYRSIVEHDLMEHRAVAEATGAAIDRWLAARPAQAEAPRMVDLGCGDLALLAPTIRRLPLASYTGLDLSAAVLPLAQRALEGAPYPCHWLEADLLSWAEARVRAVQEQAQAESTAATDILHSSFAIHHLEDSAKQAFLRAARQRIAPGGLFLWVDVFREPGEARQAYVQRYRRRVESDWLVLSAEQQEQVISHFSSFDHPADRAAIQTAAEAEGWKWHWAWQGAHRAEALAVLTPA